jgi:hypothetical protein
MELGNLRLRTVVYKKYLGRGTQSVAEIHSFPLNTHPAYCKEMGEYF